MSLSTDAWQGALILLPLGVAVIYVSPSVIDILLILIELIRNVSCSLSESAYTCGFFILLPSILVPFSPNSPPDMLRIMRGKGIFTSTCGDAMPSMVRS